MFGYDKEEFENKFENKFSKFVCEQDLEQTIEKIKEQAQEKDLVLVKFRVESVDESLRQVGACGRVFDGKSGGRWIFFNIVPVELLRSIAPEN